MQKEACPVGNSKHSYESLAQKLDKLVADVVNLLILRGKIIATAESCTGGLISELITSVPGSSQVFELGICTYANRMKQKYLDVPEDELNSFGAVSKEVALSMVRGLKKASDADMCISVTGVAGPDGGTPDKPVGTVYAGFIYEDREFVELFRLYDLDDMSRDSVRNNTAACVFEVIQSLLMEEVM